MDSHMKNFSSSFKLNRSFGHELFSKCFGFVISARIEASAKSKKKKCNKNVERNQWIVTLWKSFSILWLNVNGDAKIKSIIANENIPFEIGDGFDGTILRSVHKSYCVIASTVIRYSKIENWINWIGVLARSNHLFTTNTMPHAYYIRIIISKWGAGKGGREIAKKQTMPSAEWIQCEIRMRWCSRRRNKIKFYGQWFSLSCQFLHQHQQAEKKKKTTQNQIVSGRRLFAPFIERMTCCCCVYTVASNAMCTCVRKKWKKERKKCARLAHGSLQEIAIYLWFSFFTRCMRAARSQRVEIFYYFFLFRLLLCTFFVTNLATFSSSSHQITKW